MWNQNIKERKNRYVVIADFKTTKYFNQTDEMINYLRKHKDDFEEFTIWDYYNRTADKIQIALPVHSFRFSRFDGVHKIK